MRIRQDQNLSQDLRRINDQLAQSLEKKEIQSFLDHGEDPNALDEATSRFKSSLHAIIPFRSPEEYDEKLKTEQARSRHLVAQRRRALALLTKTTTKKLSSFDALLEQTELWMSTTPAHESEVTQSPVRKQRSGPARVYSQDECASHEDTEREINLTPSSVRSRLQVTPPYLSGELRSYQLNGVNWLVSLHDNDVNGILADEMGLGKTFQTIAFLAYLKFGRSIPGPHLVLCPKSVLGNWAREFRMWCPSLHVYRFHTGHEHRDMMIKAVLNPSQLKRYDVIISTFEMVRMELGSFRKIMWNYLIVDEAHRLKSDESLTTSTVRSLNTSHRLLVTGTPLQNNLRELWTLLNFVIPDLFTNADEFDSWFDTSTGSGDESVISRLYKLLAPLMLRRLKSEVSTSIPPKKEIYVECGLTRMQKEQYTALLAKDYETINKGSAQMKQLSNIVMQLRKCCNHPYLFDGVEDGPPFITNEALVQASGKLSLLDRLIKKLRAEYDDERQHKVLIFSQMTRMLDIVEDYCNYRGYRFGRIDGGTSAADRDRQMHEFNNPKSDMFLFLLSTRAGGLGINLQAANYVIIYDSDWNPQQDLQAQDRAHRLGQKRHVTVLRFICEGTLEERIYKRALKKLYLDAMVVQQGRMQAKEDSLGAKEMLGMIRFGVEAMFKNKNEPLQEEDLDVLLNRGETRVKALREELLEKQETTLANFHLGIEESNMYEFEGINYSDEVPKKTLLVEGIDQTISQADIENTLSQWDIAPAQVFISPERDKTLLYLKSIEGAKIVKQRLKILKDCLNIKVTFVTQDTFISKEMLDDVKPDEAAEELGRGARARMRQQVTAERVAEYERQQAIEALKMPKIPKLPEFKKFHLVSPTMQKRLTEIHDTEVSLMIRKWEKQVEILKAKRVSVPGSESPKTDTPDKGTVEEEINPLEFELTLEEKEEKARLLQTCEEFTDWTYTEVRQVTNAMIHHGRLNLENICDVLKDTKTPEKVRAYVRAFWQRGQECYDHAAWQNVLKHIEKGEKKLEREQKVKEAISWKLRRLENEDAPTGRGAISREQLYDQAIDQHIIRLAQENDFSNFSVVARELNKVPECRFDFHIRSRTPAQIIARFRGLACRFVAEKQREESGTEGLGTKRTRSGKRSSQETPTD